MIRDKRDAVAKEPCKWDRGGATWSGSTASLDQLTTSGGKTRIGTVAPDGHQSDAITLTPRAAASPSPKQNVDSIKLDGLEY